MPLLKKIPEYLSSCSLEIVVPQHAAEPLATWNVAITSVDFLSGFDYSICDPLVIVFIVEMYQERGNCVSWGLSAQKDHSIETLPLLVPTSIVVKSIAPSTSQ